MINYMEENCESWSPSPPKRQVPPMITLPSRPYLDNYVTSLSPGPMTLVSNFFADHYPDTDLSSFSQLLAEVLPSPIAPNSLSPLINHELSSNCQNISEESKKNRQDIAPQSSNSEAEPVVSVTNKPASDRYNWRKYGQKQVKSSDLPRCYYKCSQIDCPVTKKVGYFLNGTISDIIYKGQHNHEPPPCPKRVKYGAAMDQHTRFVESMDAHQQSNHIVLNEVMTDERKRKMEVGSADQVSLSRVMITGPKIVVQTRSEVDILDDGFKWRKYGQKVVKGNTYPRGYYKCAYAGCKVRKHVERASSDPKSVVTTYEGKHKHDIPKVAKPSSSTVTNLKTESPFLLQLKEEQITIYDIGSTLP